MVTAKKISVSFILFILIVSFSSCGQKKNVIEYKGGAISEKEVNDKARMELFQNLQDRYQIQVAAGEKILTQKLLDLKAKEKSSTPDALITEYLSKNFVPVNEEFVKGYYHANKSQIGQPYEAIRDDLFNAFNRHFQEQALNEFYNELHKEYDVKVVLAKPSPPKVNIDMGDDPALSGTPSSKIQVVEFSDFECPYCKKMQQEARSVREKFGDKIYWVFKDYPLPMHGQAMPAHIASNCAHKQGKYKEMHDKIFELSPQLSLANIESAAKELGLQMEQFKNCMLDKDGGMAKEVEQDMRYGQELGVSGTPAIFINGKFYNGYIPAAQLEKILEQELNS